MVQKSYVMIKPGFANNNKIIDYVITALQKHNLNIVTSGFIQYDKQRAQRHYHEHVGKDFYPNLEEYITSDKAFGMIVEGENAIATIRELAGATKNPVEGTIRHDVIQQLGIEYNITKNVIHSSDSEQSAFNEINIFLELQKEFEDAETN